MRRGGAVTPAALLVVLAAPPGAHPDAAASLLDEDRVSASGRQSAIVTIPSFGRYAVTVASPQGTGLQVVDRMAGPGPVFGTPGERDGRVDLFLERGHYKVVTHGHRKATGDARLAVRPFAERHAPKAPLLVELKPVETTLRDFEQASYWIDVRERRRVVLEAAGRSLADLRLWRDGTWLVDAVPDTQVVQPVPGRPLLVCRLTTVLEPALYLLTAYGGAPQPWAEEDDAHPFHLRFGIPRLGEAGRQRFAVSAFGADRFLVPGMATYFRIELPEAAPASLTVGTFDADDPFRNDGPSQDVSKKSVPPVAALDVSAVEDLHVVTVGGSAGQPFVLQHFEVKYEHRFERSGRYWISTVHSGHPTDSVDATALLVRWPREDTQLIEPLLDESVELGRDAGWARRANLLGTLTLFLRVRERGEYEVTGSGVEARYRVEPFMVSRPPKYEPPPFRPSPSAWDLEPGHYVLTVEPVRRGILDLQIRPKGLVAAALEALGLAGKGGAVRAQVRFPAVDLADGRAYTLFLNRQPEVRAGLVLRRLPLDLTEPLAVTQRPSETVSVPFQAVEAGALRAEAEDGSVLEVSLDGGPWQNAAVVAPGPHVAAVRSGRSETVVYALRLQPTRLLATTPLPEVPDATLAAIPEFPVLTDRAARPLDLVRTQSASFLVRAETPGLYRLESTGLLATEGNLRTRTITSFARESENGVGRNFLLQQYLREGDYQVTVSAQGLSAGHLGLALTRTRIHDGGFLTLGAPARISLPAGEAVSYRFKITKPGSFRVRAVGLGRTFRCRLEDPRGWPIVAPDATADVTEDFGPGTYRLVLLPQATAARAVTLIEPTPRPRRLRGHGPHRLGPARRVDHVWLEPAEGQERTPDVWEVAVPAPMEATVELTGEMKGRLLRLSDDGTSTEVAFVPPGRGFEGRLEAGRHRLEVVCSRRNNRAPYTVAVWPEPLVAGLDREVTAPADVPVSVGSTGLVEISSFGSADVRARLFDADGRPVAASDDRPDDWNFHLAASLAAGTYRLRVDPVGEEGATVTVSMRVPQEVAKPALSLPATSDVALGRAAQVFPLALPTGAELLLATARSDESVGIALEAAAPEGAWRTVGSATGRAARLEVPLAQGTSFRLRLWSLDRRGSPVRLTAAAVAPLRVAESRLRDGVSLAPVEGLKPAVGVAAVALDRPGLLQVEGGRWSAAPLAPLTEAPNGVLPATGTVVWVAAELPASGRVRGTRVTLAPGRAVPVQLPADPARCDLASARGPVVVKATSRAGQPGLGIGGGDAAPSGTGMAVGVRAAVAAALAGDRSSAVVWSGARTGPPPEVQLEQWSFDPVERERVAPRGAWEGAVTSSKARAADLGGGPKRVHVALSEGLVAVLSKGDAPLSVHWGGGTSLAETVETEADRVTVLPLRDAEDRFSVEAIPLAAGEATPPLSPGASHERAHVRAGVVRIPVAPASGPVTVHVRGAREEPLFVGGDGRVARGADVPVGPAGGTLVVSHGPGLLLAWADRPGEEAGDLWARAEAPAAIVVAPPASLILGGAARAFRIEPKEPVMLHVRAAGAAVTLLRRLRGADAGAAPEVEVHPSGVVFDAYLAAAPSELVLRAVAGGSLSGTAEITATPVTSLGEGLGPEVLLAPGATRLFSFTVERDAPVGIGVRAGSDVVESTLLTSAGRRLGSGVVQMPRLSPGTYLLALHAPADGGPVRARPALAGLRPPDTGPPEDVVRRYFEPEEAPPSFSAVHVREPESTRGEYAEGEYAEGEYDDASVEGVDEYEEGGEEAPEEGEAGPADPESFETAGGAR